MIFSPELVDERIKVVFEPLPAQITVVIEIMDRLNQSNLAKETTTASFRGIPHRYESPHSEVRVPYCSIADHRGIKARHVDMRNPKHTSTTSNTTTPRNGH